MGRRLAGRAQVLAIEVASTSTTYAWDASGPVTQATKVTLFPDRRYEQLTFTRRFWALWRAVHKCRLVLLGISYADPATILLAWALRLTGKRVIAMCDSKFDDKPRNLIKETLKGLNLLAYAGAIVAGRRHHEYFRFLGFWRRPLLLGYDTVSVERITGQIGRITPLPFAERPFLYVGRFVAKKNLRFLLDGYALYAAQAGDQARRLVLVGAGEQEQALRLHATKLKIAHLIEMPGFLQSVEISRRMAQAHALLLLSDEEQWGLVINESIAVGLPVIASDQAGARDSLLRNLINGHIIECDNVAGLAKALAMLASDEAHWQALSAGAKERAWAADVERFADAVDLLIDPQAQPAGRRMQQLFAANGLAIPDSIPCEEPNAGQEYNVGIL